MAKKELADALCETLSLFQDYNLEKIVLEMDKNFVETYSQLTMEDLDEVLLTLVKEKKVLRKTAENGEKVYRRCFPKKSLYQRLIRWWEYRK